MFVCLDVGTGTLFCGSGRTDVLVAYCRDSERLEISSIYISSIPVLEPGTKKREPVGNNHAFDFDKLEARSSKLEAS